MGKFLVGLCLVLCGVVFWATYQYEYTGQNTFETPKADYMPRQINTYCLDGVEYYIWNGVEEAAMTLKVTKDGKPSLCYVQ